MIVGSGRSVAHAWSRSVTSSVPVARVRRLARPLPSPLRRETLLHRKDGSSREHVKHRELYFVGEDRQGLTFAVLLVDPRQDLLAVFRMAQEQHGGLGERPLQMHVAHLRAARPEFLSTRLVHALDQPRVGGTLLHATKPRDVVNLVQVSSGPGLSRSRAPIADGGTHRRRGASLLEQS
jgi:hypothetical protein